MNTPLYRLCGWEAHKTSNGLNSYIFDIFLDAEFAKKCLAFKPETEFIYKLKTNVKLSLNAVDARYHFFDGSFLPISMSVSGNCCCTGMDGREQDPKYWDTVIRYYGHNIDTEHQAYKLLSLFCHWVDIAEAIIQEKEGKI